MCSAKPRRQRLKPFQFTWPRENSSPNLTCHLGTVREPRSSAENDRRQVGPCHGPLLRGPGHGLLTLHRAEFGHGYLIGGASTLGCNGCATGDVSGRVGRHPAAGALAPYRWEYTSKSIGPKPSLQEAAIDRRPSACQFRRAIGCKGARSTRRISPSKSTIPGRATTNRRPRFRASIWRGSFG